MKPKSIQILALLMALTISTTAVLPAQAIAATTLKQGSASGDVWDLQFRMQLLGFYNMKMDGQYGVGTTNAVKRFQRTYGLTADGVTGASTWKAAKTYSLNKQELDILAKVIYSEARGEPYKGQVAVGAVVMNRLKSKQFPDTLYDIVFQPGAFTAVDDGQYWLTPNSSAYRAAQEAVRGWDPTGGSLYYFNPVTATSKWIWTLPQNVKIGNHIFAG
jgi:N-acetylmuramoyl-L-alanine amidase